MYPFILCRSEVHSPYFRYEKWGEDGVYSLWITGVHNGDSVEMDRYHSTLNPKLGRKPTLSTVRRLSGSEGSSVYS